MSRRWMGSWVLSAAAAAMGCSADQPSNGEEARAGEAASAVVTDCEYLNQSLVAPLTDPVVFEHELLIRDLSVVEDPCRTSASPPPPPACAGSSDHAWTFGQLMKYMAGDLPVETFIAEWLHTFEVSQTANTFVVPARPLARQNLIDPWLMASGCATGAPIVGPGACPLDIWKAPFRLLAIVNRVDLAGPVPKGRPGELRFVFGLTHPTIPESVDFHTGIILEYKLPSNRDAIEWAELWHELAQHSMGSPGYLDALEAITDAVTSEGAEPGALNRGSALGQIRTNDFELGGMMQPWEFRQYELRDVGNGPNRALLQLVPVTDSPDHGYSGGMHLDSYIDTNEPQILKLSHTVPLTYKGDPFLGASGKTTLSGGSPALVWQSPGADPMARHMFAFATCAGCHGPETDTQLTEFSHVKHRSSTIPAPLSFFLGVSTAPKDPSSGLPAATLEVNDPVDPSLKHEFNEPWRRVCEMTRLLNKDPIPYTNAHGAH